MSPCDFATPSMTACCSRLSALLAAAVWSWKSSSEVIDGTRAGAPVRASGELSLAPARWNEPAPDICRRPLPIQPSVRLSSVLAACQMSIERKCDWLGFG